MADDVSLVLSMNLTELSAEEVCERISAALTARRGQGRPTVVEPVVERCRNCEHDADHHRPGLAECLYQINASASSIAFCPCYSFRGKPGSQ